MSGCYDNPIGEGACTGRAGAQTGDVALTFFEEYLQHELVADGPYVNNHGSIITVSTSTTLSRTREAG
jgi:hypothetical protein